MRSQLRMRSALRLQSLTRPVVVLDVFEQDLDGVADLDVVGVVELVLVDEAFGLEADLDDEVVAGLADDLALDDGALGRSSGCRP